MAEPPPIGHIEVSGDIGLKQLFESQDQAHFYNCQRSKLVQEGFDLLDKSIRLNLSILSGMRFGSVKQTAIRLLTVDALSHIAVAARVGLWGAQTESLSILRGGVESCAQLSYVVSQKLFEIAIEEIKGKRLKKLKFASVCKCLGTVGASYRKYHSRISNLAPHSTPQRLRRAEYKIQGEPYDRLGFAFDDKSAAISISECIELIQNVGVSLAAAYDQDGMKLQEVWVAGLREINTAHQALRNQIRAKYAD